MLSKVTSRFGAHGFVLAAVTFVGCNCQCRGGATANTGGVSATPVVVTTGGTGSSTGGGVVSTSPGTASSPKVPSPGTPAPNTSTAGTAGGSGWATGTVAPTPPPNVGRGTAGANGAVSDGASPPLDSHAVPRTGGDVAPGSGSAVGVAVDAGAPFDGGARGNTSPTGAVKPKDVTHPTGTSLETPGTAGGKPKPPPLAPTATNAPTRTPPPINQR
ncbi:MAG: hypothetical protein U0169_06305 [Polyangiaceae bacterium]